MHLPGKSVGLSVRVLCGVVGETLWWGFGGLLEKYGGGLWVLVLCWSFPAWWLVFVGLVDLGVWSFLWGSTLWIVPLMFGAGFPGVKALGFLFLLWPSDAGFLVLALD